jgi:hypothetical protein
MPQTLHRVTVLQKQHTNNRDPLTLEVVMSQSLLLPIRLL